MNDFRCFPLTQNWILVSDNSGIIFGLYISFGINIFRTFFGINIFWSVFGFFISSFSWGSIFPLKCPVKGFWIMKFFFPFSSGWTWNWIMNFWGFILLSFQLCKNNRYNLSEDILSLSINNENLLLILFSGFIISFD